MSMTRTLSFVALAALFVLAAIAASNPKVEPPECEGTEVETCEVDGPSAGSVAATADCTNFTFRLSGVVGGSERVVRKEEYSGGEDCMEPKTLSDETKNLAAQVSWEVVSSNASGVVRNSGTGDKVELRRVNGACRATCTFEVTVSPSVCEPPAPVVRTAEAVFVDDVRVDVGTPPRLCCVSENHSPHRFKMKGCDCPVLRIDPPGVATIVRQDCKEALVLGIEAHEGATAIAEAPCGLGTNTFDIVDIGPLVVSGLCGCLSASDSTQDDADAPEVETMDFGPNATGFSLSLPVAPSKWATDARWLVGRDRWMPVAGNFADGEQQTFSESASKYPATFDAWFDCEPDGVRATDEPKRRVTGTIARLGTLKVEREPNAEGEQGPTNRCEESFAPGEFAVFTNLDVLPVGREHTLKVVGTMPRYKDKSMTIPLGPVPGSGNSWRLKIPEDCADGLFWVELEDPLHSCTSIVKRLCVQACLCMSCDEFAKEVLENGCIDVTFGLGRTSSGGGKAPVRFVLDRTDVLPDISSESAPDGRMDVSTSNGVMTVAFKRKGEQSPVAIYSLTHGADAFTMRETRDGSLRKTVVWTLADGVWTMEVFDETVAPRELVRRDVRTTRPTARGVAHTLARGGEVVETETEEIDGIGPMPIRETRGTGAEARTTWKSYYTSGTAKGRIKSELSPDGSWTMYSYDSTGRVETVVSPFGDSSPLLDDNHAVIGYNGVVRRTTYSYAPVDGRDTGTLLADEPRTIVESVGSDAEGWTEVSRRYAAHFVENGLRFEVSERASAPGAAYGAVGNQRTVSTYLWNCRGAGRPLRRETPDGLVSLWSYDFTPSNVVVETTTVPAQLVGASVPACPLTVGIPHRTTIERTVEDLRGDVFREEAYVVTDLGRELLSWTDFERDAAGHELRRESSDGSLVERAWSCCGPEWEMDERGIVTVNSYDALGRQSTMTRNGVTTLWNYDLAGNATNVTRFADALVASSSTGYDSAGRLAWNVGEDGIRTEYAYSTSSEGGEVRTTIRAADTDCAVTNTVVSFRDGNTKASYLNNVLKATETYEPFASATYEGTNGLASARWTRSESDFLGRTVSESRPGFGGSTLVTSNLYDTAGRLSSSESLVLDPENIKHQTSNIKLFLYDNLNERVATVSDRNFNSIIDWAGPDLISSNSTHYVKLDGDWWRETRQWSIHDDNSTEARLMGVRRSRVTGLGRDALVASAPNATLASESVSIDQRGNATTNRVWRNRVAAEEVAWVKYPTSTTPAVTTSTNGLVRSSVSQTGVTTTFAYDAFQREVSQTDGRGNTTRTVYDNLGRIASTIDALGYATAYGYDALGRQVSVTDPLTNTVTTAYGVEGRIVSQRGATYPVDYAYDEFGEKIAMTTYRNAGGPGFVPAAGDTTTWLRDEATGLVTNKVYADGKGPTYTYTPDGKLATRTLAGGDECVMLYDEKRRLQEVSYSSADTPCVAFERDRSGMALSGSMFNGDNASYLRDEWHCTTNEILHIGNISFTIGRRYDEFGRDEKVDVWFNGTRYSSKVRIYDDSGRISAYAMTNSAGRGITVGYSYDADSRVSSLRYGLSGGSELRLDLDRDPLRPGLVTNRVYTYEQEEIYRYSVAYDVLGHPIGATDLFQIGREWLYNSRSELVSALVGTNSYGYGYDTIGNRIRSNENTVTNFYAANSLNQYSSIGSDTNFVYDADGNMMSDGTFSYSYDAENRLLAAYPLSPVVGSLAVENRYDYRHRRSRKIVKRYDGADWKTKETRYFLGDGNNIVLERVEFANGASRTFEYFWGADKSGSEQGAGGVEGLLAVSMDGVFYIPGYDHNGNIVLYVSETGSIAAQYVYDPYGNVVETYGNLAEAFSFAFSTKYHDRETGMVGYQRRFYRPDLGRWLNRDPIEESGGINLYAFCQNAPSTFFDFKGLTVVRINVGTEEMDSPRGFLNFIKIETTVIEPPKGNGKLNFIQLKKSVNSDWELDIQGTQGPYYYRLFDVKKYTRKNDNGNDVITLYDAPGGFIDKVDFYTAVVEINRSCQSSKHRWGFPIIKCYDIVKVIASVSWSFDPNVAGGYQYSGKSDGFIMRGTMIPTLQQLINNATWKTELCPSTKVEVQNGR